jgi:hypothetical protein
MVMSFKFNSNSKQVNAKLSNMVAVQMPFAVSKALNDTATTLVAKNKQDMRLIFKNTVNYTLNAFGRSPFKFGPMKMVRKGQNRVFIRRKDDRAKRHYLEVQQTGGPRPRTGIETKLQYNLPTTRYIGTATPTRRLKRNKSGGISMGEVNKILSALHLQSDKSTNSPKYGQSGKTKRSRQFFVPAPSHPLGQGRRFGIYERTPAGNAKKLINISERAAVYKPKLKFYQRMNRFGNKVYPAKMQKALKFAMRTAKFK